MKKNKKNLFYVLTLRAFVFALALTIKLAGIINRVRKKKKKNNIILLTGTFYSENWILNLLMPLAESSSFDQIYLVSNIKIRDIDRVKIIYPNKRLKKMLGEVPARLITFIMLGLKLRPDFIGGYHLLINGLIALLVSRITLSNSIYINGGGPFEVLGGGYLSSRLFAKLGGPDDIIERKLIRCVGLFDLVVTMGRQAIEFFEHRGVRTRFEVIPGGIHVGPFPANGNKKRYDLIVVASLNDPVKRLDVFIQTVHRLSMENPEISAVVVGTGAQENSMKEFAQELGIEKNVIFAGFVEDVNEWLLKSKVFMLTSDSEGLSLALMEAMVMGLPAVVSAVGELSDLVEHGVNGFLVKHRNPEEFARFAQVLLDDTAQYNQFSKAAHKSVKKYNTPVIIQKWNSVINDI